MEYGKFKDVLENIRERFTNPLIFSFVCSWLVINWQITITLIWHDTKEIEKAHYSSIYDLIERQTNLNNCLYHPLLFAVGYTFLMPLIKNIIKAFNSWAAKWGETWNLKILKDGKIPIDKYLKIRREYEKRTVILEEVINKDNVNFTRLNQNQTEILNLKANVNKLETEKNDLSNFVSQMHDIQLLDGIWINQFRDEMNSAFNGSKEIEISAGKYYVLSSFGAKELVFNITNFYFNVQNKQIFFIKERIKNPIYDEAKYNINNLTLLKNDWLQGTENGTVTIEYRRKN